jgi:hypothetical protein
LVDEAEGYFRNSFAFTVVLTLIGIAFIILGILFKKNESLLTARLRPFIPSRVRQRHALPVAETP